MERQPAKVLRPGDVRRLLRSVTEQRYPERARVMALLSFKAGLRACEISGLSWAMVLASNKRIGSELIVSKHIAKKGSGRRIPLHVELKQALHTLHQLEGKPLNGPVVRSERGGHMSAGSVVN